MNARLISLSGPTQGDNFSLNDLSEFNIGRDETNDLVITDWVASRRHCSIRRENDQFWLHDLNSHNGTLVNNKRASNQQLVSGDVIRVGSLCLRFAQETEDPVTYDIEFHDTLTTQSAIRLHLSQSELNLEQNALVKFGEALNSAKNFEVLQQKLLKIVLEIIPASRSAMVVVDDDMDKPHSICVVDEQGSRSMQLSRTVTQLVLREQVGLLSNSLVEKDLDSAESLISSHVRAVLAVPLTLGRNKGLLYLDSTTSDFRFDEKHLQALTAMSFLIAGALIKAQQAEELRRENERLQSEVTLKTNMIGECPPMQHVFRLLGKVASSETTILITGESGTGKELAARAIHQNGKRRNKPFIAINCAVLNPNLLESELFGHEKGAFTGATGQKKGKFELADGGTIFLDEVGELQPELQAKLLRFLQEREFERVGGNHTIKVDVRVVAATNRNLKEAIKKGTFRDDLFFRLNVLSVRLPSLRERHGDIPVLARHFLNKYSPGTTFSDKAFKALCRYEWPGNVRELQHAIEGAVVLSSADSIQIEDLPEAVVESWQGNKAMPYIYEQFTMAKRKIVQNALDEAEGSYTAAAGVLGVHPNNLHRIAKRLGLKDDKSE